MDSLEIKTINEHLIWNSSIVDIIEYTCYYIDFLTNKIEVFLSRGEFLERIEFINGKIGTYSIDEINKIHFDTITFELISPVNEVKRIIQTWVDEKIKIELSGNELTLKYQGNNPQYQFKNELFTDKVINIDNIDNWKVDIKDLRKILKSEYRYYSYDFNNSIVYNYGWLEFKDIEIIGLKKYGFRAYFHYNGEGIIKLEAIIGNTISDYEIAKESLISNFGQPKSVESANANNQYNHNFKNDVWLIDKLEIILHSVYIPRSEPEQFRYELEIKRK